MGLIDTAAALAGQAAGGIPPLRSELPEWVEPPAGVVEFGENLMQVFLQKLYDGFYASCEKGFNGMFHALNSQVAAASADLTTAPAEWSSTGFALVKNTAETIFLPIGCCILVFVFCWDLVQMMQDSNRMHSIRPEAILMKLLKLALCLLACSKSFDIIMGFFEVGRWATGKLNAGAVGTFGEGLSLADVLPAAQQPLDFFIILQLCGYILLIYMGWLAVLVCYGAIYVRVSLWFLELYMYSTAAPVPFGTFCSREWGQMGMNYTRKMLAVCFEGFFMLLAFALYGALLNGLGGTGFTETMVLVICCGFGMVMLICRAGSISASIFNAH